MSPGRSPVDLVIGLTGANAAGKGEVAAHLRGLGFTLHSLSDIVREEAASRGLPPEREHLIEIGRHLRRQSGSGILAERILTRLGSWDVVDSIRSPAEVVVLRRLPHFLLLGVAASAPIRFQRSVLRGRPGDPQTVEEFQARENQENAPYPESQQLDATFRMADRVVGNDGTLDELHRAVDALLTELRPDVSRQRR